MRFDGKVAMVAGAGAGIGEAAAKLLAGDGAELVLVDRDIAPWNESRLTSRG